MVGLGAAAVKMWAGRQRAAAAGREELAAAIAETDQLDPRWRWEQIEEDRPVVPDAENSIRVLRQLRGVTDWPRPDRRSPAVREVLEDWPANRRLDGERLARMRDLLKTRERGLAQAASLKDFPRGAPKYSSGPT
jgi:hypothetical protein